MAEYHERLRFLLNLYANKGTTQVDEDELFDLLSRAGNAELEPILAAILEQTEPLPDEERRERIMGKIIRQNENDIAHEPEAGRLQPFYQVQRRLWQRVAVAASIILILGAGGYFLFFNKPARQPETAKAPPPRDVEAPKSIKAMITLDDGRTIALDSVTSGMLATQGDVKVVKTTNGQIVYQGSAVDVRYNTLFNPRGSKPIPLTLSDGTTVWLNSESSLRYPTAFIGKERNVEITGEAYFEVAKDAARKFTVRGNGVITEVLGTHFNVNTYTGESSINVTLLEGSVKVSKPGAAGSPSAVIKPGQQAQLKANGELSVLNDVDLAEVMAWKNGKFQFGEAADIVAIMREISRWYDLDVEYKGVVKGHIGGTISRDVNASKLFEMLEMTGAVTFRIDGKKVIVIPK